MLFDLALKKTNIFDNESTFGKTAAAMTSGMLGAIVGLETDCKNLYISDEIYTHE